MSGWRPPAGGGVDRSRPLHFTFDGVSYAGLFGDTLASALLANQVGVVARSVYLGRPRGILAAGSEEPNALVALGPEADPELVRATQTELFDGLVARSLAGKGPAPGLDERRSEHRHVHCDVLVVGAGPAGLAAARMAGRSGARVILLDENPGPGGSLAPAETIEGRPGLEWADLVAAELAALPETRVLLRTTAVGRYDANLVLAVQRPDPAGRPDGSERLWHIRARRVVVATGAVERPIVFRNNDRPGIMLAGAVRRYLHRYGVAAGRRAVVFTTNDSAYPVAIDLVGAGVAVATIVDARPGTSAWTERAAAAGINVLPGHVVVDSDGATELASVEVAAFDGSRTVGPARTLACDLLAVSGGWNPSLQLYAFPGGRPRYELSLATYVPGPPVEGVSVAGAASGAFALGDCLAGGARAGGEAATATGYAAGPEQPYPVAEEPTGRPIRPVWLVPDVGAPMDARLDRHFVDLQRDATVAGIQDAIAAGMRYPEHIKRYTTIGTGNDQGRTSSVNEVGIVATLLGQALDELAPTAFRPPVIPVAFGTLAGPYRGDLYDPIRTTPAHASHAALGARFENVGQWKRAWVYPRSGESFDEAVRRECRAVRGAVGLMDVSTLGKIEVRGPDAGIFLDRVYTNQFSTLRIGASRYGLMCHADGMVMDDGTTTCLAEDRFYMTTTTSGAAAVFDWLEEWSQTEWPELRVRFTSVTDEWAAVAIAGPRARALLARLAPDLDLSPEAFPWMTMREGTVAGLAARIFRISFSGELSFEVNVRAWHGRSLWDAAMAAGTDLGVTPYGTEAMHVLRAEKGYVIVGQDSDGTTTPLDLGLDWMVSKKKWFIGRRSLARPAMLAPDRRQLVGLLPVDPMELVPEGSPLLPERRDAGRQPGTAGHVTSSYFSPALGRTFAMGLLAAGRARIGATVEADVDGRLVTLQVVAPVFHDPNNERRDG